MATPEMYAGETKHVIINVADKSGNVVDLNGSEFIWKLDVNNIIKSSPSPDITLLDAINGKLQITLNPSDTLGAYGNRKQELKITDSNGNVSYARELDMIKISPPPI